MTAFEERQSHPSWLGPVLLALAVPALVVTAVVVFDDTGTGTGTGVGVTPESIGTLLVVALAVLGPIPVLDRAELRTTVQDDGIAIRYVPFHRTERYVSFDDLTDVRRAQRRPYQYGIRRTRWGWEYRPNSSVGVECYRETGPPIFLGSERPHELQTAIEAGLRAGRSEATATEECRS